MPPHVFIWALVAWGVYAVVRSFRRNWPGDDASFALDLAGTVLAGAGVAAPLSAAGFVLWMFGEPGRRNWVIRGPAPFGSFGSGPYLMALLSGFVLLSGAMVAVGIFLRGMAQWRAGVEGRKPQDNAS